MIGHISRNSTIIWRGCIVALCIAGLTAPESAAAACGWNVTPSDNPFTTSNILLSVAANSATDAWAVGWGREQPNSDNQSLTEHWNGSAWTAVPGPDVSNTGYLDGVATVSANDVWAVGAYGSRVAQTMIGNWNGTSWTVVPSPDYNHSYNNVLGSVAAVGSNDVWAVGEYATTSGTTRTLIEHWDGIRWKIVTSPNVGTGSNHLNAVAARSARNVWVVGSYQDGNTYRTLTEHWDGLHWTVVPSPNANNDENVLSSVAAICCNVIWAVGFYNVGSQPLTLTEHWNRDHWAVVPSPNPPGSPFNFLYGVSAIASHDVWAVGSQDNGTTGLTLTEHWNGIQWTIVSSPNAGPDSSLVGVAAIRANQILSVGTSFPHDFNHVSTLTEFFHC